MDDGGDNDSDEWWWSLLHPLLINLRLYFWLLSIVGITPLAMPKDTSKLKKHVALLCDRLNKGGKLDLSMTSGQQASELPIVQQQRQIKALEPLDEMQEDEEDETGKW